MSDYSMLGSIDTYPDVEESASLVLLLKMGLVHYPYQPKNKIGSMTNLLLLKIWKHYLRFEVHSTIQLSVT
jgi:hypothetical protein